MEVDGSDDDFLFKEVVFRFQTFIFRGCIEFVLWDLNDTTQLNRRVCSKPLFPIF